MRTARAVVLTLIGLAAGSVIGLSACPIVSPAPSCGVPDSPPSGSGDQQRVAMAVYYALVPRAPGATPGQRMLMRRPRVG